MAPAFVVARTPQPALRAAMCPRMNFKVPAHIGFDRRTQLDGKRILHIRLGLAQHRL
jgi:hypothetical protein